MTDDGKLAVGSFFFIICSVFLEVCESRGDEKEKDKVSLSVVKSPLPHWVSEGSRVIIYEAQITKQTTKSMA